MSESQCHLYCYFFDTAYAIPCYTELFKMSNEIFIQFHILEKITVGNLNIKYIEFYKVSVILRGSPIHDEIGLSDPEIWAANVMSFRCPHAFKPAESL